MRRRDFPNVLHLPHASRAIPADLRPSPDFTAVQLALRRALTLVRGRTALRFMP